MIQLHRVVEASEICKASDRVYALALADLRFEHAPNRNREAVFVRSGVIPGHVLVKTQLPLVKIILAVAVPKPVEAGCERNRVLNAFTL